MKRTLGILTLSLLIVGIVMLALPSATVYAQEPDPPKFDREQKHNRPVPFFPKGPKGLERLFDRLVDRYDDMGYKIHDTDDVTRKLEDRIEVLIEEGKDPSDLEAILATFKENMAAVEAEHDNVGAIIDEHAGFNDDGEVEDESVALLTLRWIAEGLLDVHQLGEDARLALHWDLITLRYQNQPEE
jgi:hypothetical protein